MSSCRVTFSPSKNCPSVEFEGRQYLAPTWSSASVGDNVLVERLTPSKFWVTVTFANGDLEKWMAVAPCIVVFQVS